MSFKRRLNRLEQAENGKSKYMNCYKKLIELGLATTHEHAFVERGGFGEGMKDLYDQVDIWSDTYNPAFPDSEEHKEATRLYNLRKPIFDEFNIALEKPEYDPWQAEQHC